MVTLAQRRSSNLGLCAAASAALAACGAGPRDARPDVVLVVIDTLRADALSCYGNPRDTTPHLDRLAREAILFEHAFAHAPNTVPSHASLFTGLHPDAHAAGNAEVPGRGPAALADAFETLAERFAAAGWQTAAFTDGAKLGPGWNLLQGFEHVECDSAGAAAKVDQALAFLRERRDGRPLFLLLHTYQVHMPYTAPAAWARRFDPDYAGPLAAPDAANRAAWNERGELPPHDLFADHARFTPRDVEHLRALYHGELAYTDAELARLWPALQPLALIAVTSDHGEEFGEHGQFGHRQLHRETLHVPLLVRLPGGELGGRRVGTRVGLIDLHALLLRSAGLAAPLGAADLAALARDGGGAERPHFAARNDRLHLGAEVPVYRALRLGPRALIERFESEPPLRLIYDLDLDPLEARPLDGAAPDLGAQLEAHAAEQERVRHEHLGAGPPPAAPALDDATRLRLRSLGYGTDG